MPRVLIDTMLWLISIALLGLGFTSAPWYRLWPFELLGSCYLWLVSFTTILFVGVLTFRSYRSHRRLILTLVITLSLYGSSILSWYIPQLRDRRAGGIPLTVMIYNVNYRHWDTEKVTDLVRSQPVDVVGCEPTVTLTQQFMYL